MASQYDIKSLECFQHKVLENETLSDILRKNNDIEILDSKDLYIETIKLQKFRCQCKNKGNLWFAIERIKYKTDPKTNKQEKISREAFQFEKDFNVGSIREFLEQFDKEKRKEMRERIKTIKKNIAELKTDGNPCEDLERLLQEAESCLDNGDCIGCEAIINKIDGLIEEMGHSRGPHL